MKLQVFFSRYLLFFGLILGLLSCSSPQQGPIFFEAQMPTGLKKKFFSYWQARRQKDWQKAWELEAPVVHEKVKPRHYQMYLSVVDKAEIEKIVVQDVKCEEQVCWVKMTVDYLVRGKLDRRTFSDRWLKEGGQWYHFLYEPLFFPQVRTIKN